MSIKLSGRRESISNYLNLWLRILSLSIALALMIFSSCAIEGDKGSISGNVTDTDGNALEGVKVTTDPGTVEGTTNSSGNYTLNGVDVESYMVVAAKEGYLTSKASATVKVDEEVVVDLALEESVPMIQATPFFIDFGNSETTRTLTIENSGNDFVQWQILTEDSWITAISADTGSTAGNGGEATISLAADRSGLENGVTTGCIEIISTIDTIKVGLQISKGAVIELSRRYLAFRSTDSLQTITIKNGEGGQLTYSIQSSVNWLSATPISRTITEETEITVAVDRTGEGFGTHYGQLTIDSNGGRDTVFVAMTVANPNAPQVFVPLTELDFSNNVSNFDLRLGNSGAGTLSWSVQEDVAWLETGLQNGVIASGGTVTLPITVNRSGLSTSGNPYVGELKIVTSDPANPEVVLPLTMLVEDQPVLSISHPLIDLGLNGDTWSLAIGNSGVGMLTWEANPVDSWISISPGSGGNATSVELSVNRNTAGFGDVSGTVDVISNGGTQQILVLLENRGNNTAPQSDFTIAPETGRLETIFNFDASITTDDYDPLDSLRFRWRWEASGDFTDWTSSPTATHQYAATGNKQVTLEVEDTNGASRTKNRTVQVVANVAPTANFTFDPPSGTTSDVFTFNAGSSTDDVDPIESLRFRWKFGSGANFTDWSSDSIITQQFVDNANHQVTLEVMDSDSAIGTRNRTVSVSTNPSPTAVFTFDPPTGTPAMLFTFNAGGSSDDSDPIDSLQFRWEFGAGNGFTDWGSDTLLTYQFSPPGDYQVTLQVRDLAGAIGEDEQTVTVVQNQSPDAAFNFSPQNGTVNRTFQFDASTTTDDFTDLADLEFRWRWTANSGFTAWMNTPFASHQYSTTGFKEVTLEVRDAEGSVGDASATIEVVENQPPNALFNVTPEVGTTATLFQFDASASTDDVDLLDSLMFRWRWANGESFTDWSVSPTAEHQYSTDGQKTVTLEVRDTGNLDGSVSKLVLVGAPPVSENEPNDSRQQANAVGHTATVFGEIGVAGDEDDWFAITAPANGKLWYQISNLEANGTPDSRIEESPLFAINELLDAVEITSAYVPHGGSRYIGAGETAISAKTIVSENRIYYIQIPQYTGHSAQYELRMFFSDLSQSDLGEDNDDQVTAFTVAANQFHQARNGFWKNGATKEDQQDWYELQFAESGVLQYTVENLHNESVANGYVDETIFYGATTFDFIELTRAGVSHGGSRYIGETELATSGKVGIDKGRSFFLQIPQYVNHAAPYEFQVNFVPSSFTDFGESNDQSTTATSISDNSENTAQIGYVVSSGQYDEKDWYKPQISTNGLLQITIENLYSNDILNGRIAPSKIYLKNILDFNEIETLQINHGGSNNYIGAGETVVSSRIAVSTAEEYFLEVPQYLTDRHQAPYKLTTTIIPTSLTGVPDANNSTGTADTVEVNTVLNAAIGYEDDNYDWYVFIAPANGSFQFSVANNHVTGVIGGRIATSFLYNSTLQVIGSATVNHGGNNNYIDAAETGTSDVVQVVNNAVYYIQVPRSEQDVAPYTLQTSFSQ